MMNLKTLKNLIGLGTLSLGFAACGAPATGTSEMSLYLTGSVSAPTAKVVGVESVEARSENGWTTVATPRVDVDLGTLKGASAAIGTTEMESGRVDRLRFHLRDADGTRREVEVETEIELEHGMETEVEIEIEPSLECHVHDQNRHGRGERGPDREAAPQGTVRPSSDDSGRGSTDDNPSADDLSGTDRHGDPNAADDHPSADDASGADDRGGHGGDDGAGDDRGGRGGDDRGGDDHGSDG